MILKCNEIYIDLLSVRAYKFGCIQFDTEAGGLVTSLVFYIVPKPISVHVFLTEDRDVKNAQKIIKHVGEEIAKLIYIAKKRENKTHMEDLLNILQNAREAVYRMEADEE